MSDTVGRYSIQLQHRTYSLLHAVAAKRSRTRPGRQLTINTVIEDLVDRHRAELEAEAGLMLRLETGRRHGRGTRRPAPEPTPTNS